MLFTCAGGGLGWEEVPSSTYPNGFHIATIFLEISAGSIDIEVIHAIHRVEERGQVGCGAGGVNVGLQDVTWKREKREEGITQTGKLSSCLTHHTAQSNPLAWTL